MGRPSHIAFLCLLATVPGCRNNGPQTTADRAGGAADTVITLIRTHCLGSCPDYRLTIRGDGQVFYEGHSQVALVGTQRTVIPRDTVRRLVQEFVQRGFLDISTEYQRAMDGTSDTTILQLPEGTKSVVDHGVELPANLVRLKERLDMAAGAARWVKPDASSLRDRTGKFMRCDTLVSLRRYSGSYPVVHHTIQIHSGGHVRWYVERTSIDTAGTAQLPQDSLDALIEEVRQSNFFYFELKSEAMTSIADRAILEVRVGDRTRKVDSAMDSMGVVARLANRVEQVFPLPRRTGAEIRAN